jgi:hypothetical protein
MLSWRGIGPSGPCVDPPCGCPVVVAHLHEEGRAPLAVLADHGLRAGRALVKRVPRDQQLGEEGQKATQLQPGREET